MKRQDVRNSHPFRDACFDERKRNQSMTQSQLERLVELQTEASIVGSHRIAIEKIGAEIAHEILSDEAFRKSLHAIVRQQAAAIMTRLTTPHEHRSIEDQIAELRELVRQIQEMQKRLNEQKHRFRLDDDEGLAGVRNKP